MANNIILFSSKANHLTILLLIFNAIIYFYDASTRHNHNVNRNCKISDLPLNVNNRKLIKSSIDDSRDNIDYSRKKKLKYPSNKKAEDHQKKDNNSKNNKFNIDKLIDIGHEIRIHPKVSCDVGSLLIIIVSSNPYNEDERSAIRKTWGRPKHDMKLIFSFGEANDNGGEIIANESRIFGDVLQGNFVDSYRNMSYKHVMGLQWASCYCSGARFVLKIDDDVFVNYPQLVQFLTEEISVFPEKNLIQCGVQNGVPVSRSRRDSWFVDMKDYSPLAYPPFCSGSFILYSVEVLPLLISESQKEKYFFIDDVFVTGFLTKKLNITLTNISYLLLNEFKFKILTEKDPYQVGTFVAGPDNIDSGSIFKMWSVLNSPS